ncbi:hypothetical protein OHD16_13095 [Sphingobacterium sp. ML3W]
MKYVSPQLNVEEVEMEQGIAAGSAAVKPGSSSNEVKSQWDTGSDSNSNVEW